MGLVLFGTSLSRVLFQIGPIELCLRSDGDDASTARAPESSSAVTVLAQQVLSIAGLSTASNSGSQASCSHVHVGAGPRTSLETAGAAVEPNGLTAAASCAGG